MKTCSHCKQILPLNNFGIQKANKWIKSDKPKSRCKVCESKGVEQSRQKTKLTNPDKHKEKQNNIVKYNNQLKQRNFAFVFRYLKIFGKCVDCGINDNRVLEFDHIKGNKVEGIIKLADKLASISRIKEEIRKCEIRCCNCHRIKTQQQLKWRKDWKSNWI